MGICRPHGFLAGIGTQVGKVAEGFNGLQKSWLVAFIFNLLNLLMIPLVEKNQSKE